jgi:hypothetical protein
VLWPPGALAGAVAQLGEHLLCKQGVAGSNPVGSTRAGPGSAGSRNWDAVGASEGLSPVGRPLSPDL